MKPDDITDEEAFEAATMLTRDGDECRDALAAQNELRDRRAVEEARRDERERIVAALAADLFVDALIEIVCGWSGETGTDHMAVTVEVRRALAHAICGVSS